MQGNDNEPDLFRAEAIKASRDRTGDPANHYNLPIWITLAFMLTIFVAAMIFVSVAPYARKETVSGYVVPAGGVVRVAALRSGIVTDILVNSGDRVDANQPLFTVSYDQVLGDGGSLSGRRSDTTALQADMSGLEARYQQAQILQNEAELVAKMDGLETDIVLLKEQKALQQERVELLLASVTAARELIDKQYISPLQMRQREDTLIQARQSLASLEQEIHRAASQIVQLRAQRASLRSGLERSQATSRLNQAQIEEKRLDNMASEGGQILARKAGRVTSLQVRQGDVIVPNQTLAMVVPDTSKLTQQVNLWVPSRALGFIENGTAVRLMFDAFPYQTFGVGKGRVIDISTAPVLPSELPIPIETREQMYKIVVALDSDILEAYGRQWRLTPGMRLTADLVLDRKSLLDWLLDPVMAARRRSEV